MCASMNGHEGVVSMLLSAGARVDIQDDAVSSTNVMLASQYTLAVIIHVI